MNKTLQNYLFDKLCPNNKWEVNDIMKSLLRYYILKMPHKEVTDEEMRYPTNPPGMRAFLIKFFSRHYLQIQNSLVNYTCSDDFINILNTGKINILDIGSGPAVASLAITDILINIIKYLTDIGEWQRGNRLKVNYMLNDTSGICLGTGQNMIKDYFRRIHNRAILYKYLLTIQKEFPENFNQLRRISLNSGFFDIAIFSYVISPLIEEKKYKSIIKGFHDIEGLCCDSAGILILQDKYKKAMIQKIGNAIGIQSKKETSEQDIFPKRNENETYKYTYYSCMYMPKNKINKLYAVA